MSLGIHNPKIDDQINHLFSEILIAQQEFDHLKPSDPEKSELVTQKLAEYESIRGRGFFFPLLGTGKGHGPFTELVDGSIKYDLIGSMGVNLLGHSHPLLIKSALEAATMDTNMVGNLHLYEDSIELSKLLVDSVPNSKLKHFWFAGSGSFANDNALKMIWQKSNGKTRLLALEKCFAGRSIATQDITHNTDYKKGMPTLLNVDYFKIDNSDNLKEQIDNTINNLNSAYDKHPNEFCCLTLELVQGEGGFNHYHPEVYESIFKWAKDKKLFIWIDEIQSFGRTGELFAFQKFKLSEFPDIVTVGKALQVCGTLFSNELNPDPGLVAGTFQGSMTSIKAGYKVLNYLTKGNFFGKNGRIAQIRNLFEERIDSLSNGKLKGFLMEHSGVGLMFAFKIKDGNKEDTAKFIKLLFNNGIICFSCGRDPYKIRFLLPLCLNREHVDEIFKIIESTSEDFLGS